MKKIISSLLVLSFVVFTFGPVLVGATTGPITTSLSKGQGGGTAPVVKVKWEMKKGTSGKDDSTSLGAQLMPPGAWDAYMNYTVCAIATDPNGAADIDGVYADIFYPDNRPMHVSMDPGEIDNPSGGCGAFIEQNTLIKKSKSSGYSLFCESIRDGNYGLPVFNTTYFGSLTKEQMYDEICAPTGELMKEEAYVYCDDKKLTWEDPAGYYKVKVIAQDTAGNSSDPLENTFEYLPLTSFQVDFTLIDYGEVLLNVHKIISGDLDFNTASKATVRNLGNTRLDMKVAQDDMGLGKTSGNWNVQYDARVGNNAADWSYYSPFKFSSDASLPSSGDYTKLGETLDLSEKEEMDFSIKVTKWPNVPLPFIGKLWLEAEKADWEICEI